MSEKIAVVDGGPRKMNTAAMIDAFERGVPTGAAETEVKLYRLYDLDYKDCVSCLACRLKGRSSNVCLGYRLGDGGMSWYRG